MLIRASCLAAVAVLLTLNLASGQFYDRDSLGRGGYREPGSPMVLPNDYIDLHSSPYNNFGGRPMEEEEGEDDDDDDDDDEKLVNDGTDLQLTKAQYRQLYHGRATKGRSYGYNAILPWTDGIVPYWFDYRFGFDERQMAWIHRGMRVWENVTCVRFVPVHQDDKSYLAIWKGGGCFAGLGMRKEHVQAVSLPRSCYFRTSIEHELGHTLGLMHEHQRHNRDDYVRVNHNALIRSGASQLHKYAPDASDKFGLPYDYDSVMHYDKVAYTNNWAIQTIYPKLVSKTDVIGNVMVPSFYDIKLVNLMYKCKDRCKTPPPCQEPCFVNERCQCFCQKDAPKEVCQDTAHDCAQRAAEGKCQKYPRSMLDECRLTCGACTLDGSAPQLLCMDTNDGCTPASCKNDSARFCKKTCNLCPDNNKQPWCVDRSWDCARKARNGECDTNPEVMLTKCTKSCDFCYRKKSYRHFYPVN